MTTNKQTVERFMAAFRRSDHAGVLACLADDVEWHVPGAFTARGRAAFDEQIEHPEFVSGPDIKVARLTEEAGVVVAEGTVRTERKDGAVLQLMFCDVFELRDGLIRRLTSYLVNPSPAA